MKAFKITYSSSSNISFTNDYHPDYSPVPDDWEDMTADHQGKYIDELIEEYIYNLVEVYPEIVDVDDDTQFSW